MAAVPALILEQEWKLDPNGNVTDAVAYLVDDDPPYIAIEPRTGEAYPYLTLDAEALKSMLDMIERHQSLISNL